MATVTINGQPQTHILPSSRLTKAQFCLENPHAQPWATNHDLAKAVRQIIVFPTIPLP